MTKKEYNDCVTNYSDDVYRFVVYHGVDKDYAKDIVQDAYLSLWQNHSNIEASKSKSFLLSTAYNLTNSNFRHKIVEEKYCKNINIETSTNIEKPYENKECLYKALENIPSVQKTALILKDIEGYSYKEIGEMLKLSLQQVEVYIFRARIALKKELIKMNY